MTNVSFILANKLDQISLQVSSFANGPWKENFVGIDFRQIDQNSRDTGKLVPHRFVLNKVDIPKVIL